jgi:hypothetical protein
MRLSMWSCAIYHVIAKWQRSKMAWVIVNHTTTLGLWAIIYHDNLVWFWRLPSALNHMSWI